MGRAWLTLSLITFMGKGNRWSNLGKQRLVISLDRLLVEIPPIPLAGKDECHFETKL